MNTTHQWIQLTSLADTTTYLNPELHIIRINCWTFPFQSLLYWFCCCKLFQAATSINTRYTFAVIPGWFYGTILWWSQHQDKFKPRFHRFWIGCIGLSILLTYTSNPHRALYFISPCSFQPWVYQSLPALLGHAAKVKKILNLIPQDASFSTSGYIVSHVSGHRNIIGLEVMQRKTQREK
jgi:hypothetical protein